MIETMPHRINLTPHREHLIKCHYGVYDYYKHYNKLASKEDKIDQSIYRSVLRSINEELRYKIATVPYDYKIPRGLGILKVRKYYPEFTILSDGSVKNKMAIDFKATLDLWEEDPDAYEERKKIFYENEHSDGFIFKIRYDKRKAKFRNKSVYSFQKNRKLKEILSTNIVNKNIDAFLM